MSTTRGPDDDLETPLLAFPWTFLLLLLLVGSTGAGATLLVLGIDLLACDAFTQEAGAVGLDGGPSPGKASTCGAVLGRAEGAGVRGP